MSSLVFSTSSSASAASAVSSSSASSNSSTTRPHPFATALSDNSDTDTVNDVETIADKQQGIVYQYYFLILVLGVILFIGILFVLRRRRIKKKANAANLGRHALARDLESWRPTYRQQHAPAAPPTTARRWMQRYNRFAMRNPNRIPEEDESGLNEFGEAPPPYKPSKSGLDEGGAERRRDSHLDATVHHTTTVTTTTTPAVPLRTLSRNAVGKPPGYEESLRPINSTSSLAVDQLPSRPETRRTDANSSTTDLLPRRQSSQNRLPISNGESQTQARAPMSLQDTTSAAHVTSTDRSDAASSIR